MKKLKIPENYQGVMPYLILKDAAGCIQWCIEVLDARETSRMNNEDGTIMHAEIEIAGSTIMFGEVSDKWAVNNAGMFVYVEDADQAYARAMARGATSLMPPATQPYGRTCGIKDPYGNTWWPTTAGS